MASDQAVGQIDELDAVVINPGRLRILTALAVEARQEFVLLRQRTRLTDGNLASHAKRLESAGLISVGKEFAGGKPVTRFTLTTAGREALESHARRLVNCLRPVTSEAMPTASSLQPLAESKTSVLAPAPAPVLIASRPADDDWVD